jgi:multidrug efflux system outer membrane protein
MKKYSLERCTTSTVCALAAALLASGTAWAQEQAAPQELGLDTVLVEVAEENEVWEITEARVEQARAARREAWAALLPSIALSASGTRYGEEIDFGGRQVRPQYDWAASGRVSIAIFDGTRYPLLERSGELLEATKALSKWQRSTLLFEARQSFYLLAAAQHSVDIAQRTLELRQAQLERAQALLDAKIAVKLDVERARAQMLEAKQALLEARALLGNADDALGALLAREPGASVRARVDDAALPTPPEAAPLDRIDERPDFKAVKNQIRAVELSEEAIWWSFLPLVELRADARTGPESAFSNPDGFTWSMTLSATWLLYDGGARYAQLDGLEAQVKEEKLQYQSDLRQARVGVRQALRDWKTADAAVAVARQQVEAASQAYETAQQRFEQGLDTNIDVIQASETLFRAETTLNRRTFEARVAAAEYRYLVGLLGVE